MRVGKDTSILNRIERNLSTFFSLSRKAHGIDTFFHWIGNNVLKTKIGNEKKAATTNRTNTQAIQRVHQCTLCIYIACGCLRCANEILFVLGGRE